MLGVDTRISSKKVDFGHDTGSLVVVKMYVGLKSKPMPIESDSDTREKDLSSR